jgi:hypothetical protein
MGGTLYAKSLDRGYCPLACEEIQQRPKHILLLPEVRAGTL